MSMIKAKLICDFSQFSVVQEMDNLDDLYRYGTPQEISEFERYRISEFGKRLLADRLLSFSTPKDVCCIYMGPTYTDKYGNEYVFPAANFGDLICDLEDGRLKIFLENMYIRCGKPRIGATLV